MNRKVCIHCHFYQPPRENPWLDDVEMQDSAYPFHDWNERITDECYRRNAVSRILDGNGKIAEIYNNYAKISFNFGPTLLIWMERHSPEVYERILKADKASQEVFGGHGSAIAQAYNHMIMPLANDRDKWTQVKWGIDDFQHRFRRLPEGMWLPETAVDIATLEVLAQSRIKFTILAPHQAARIRRVGDNSKDAWKNVEGDKIDTRRAYLCRLPSGAEISLFFYQGSVSQRVAYGNLIMNGDLLANEIISHLDPDPPAAQLAHIATDGETYGHHYRHGDMALAYCLHHIETTGQAELTNYGQFLEEFPPQYEVQINENSSWSCSHGVERWRDNCGCCTDPNLAGKQQWRSHLRNALDWLRDELSVVYEQNASKLVANPWAMRDRYIRVINDRSLENIDSFLMEFLSKTPSQEQKITLMRLLGMQRNTMLMYTSCGWFFNDISGIETTQVLRYAARAIQLTREQIGKDYEPRFEELLAEAPCNYKGVANGKEVYEKMVKPSRVDLHRVAAHLAISTLFGDYLEPGENSIYSYAFSITDYQQLDIGIQKLAIGRANVRSKILLTKTELDYIVLYFGGHNVTCAVTQRITEEKFSQYKEQVVSAFKNGDMAEVIRVMNFCCGENTYSLWNLFRDDLHRILYKLLHKTWDEIEASFRHIYEENYTVMKLMRNMQIAIPKALAGPAEFILGQNLLDALFSEPVDIKKLETIANEFITLSLKIEEAQIRLKCGRRLDELAKRLRNMPDNLEMLNSVSFTIKTLTNIIPHIGLEEVQNSFYMILQERYEEIFERSESGDEQAAKWLTAFDDLADHLKIAIPQLQRQR